MRPLIPVLMILVGIISLVSLFYITVPKIITLHLLVPFHFDWSRPRDFARLFNFNGHLYWDRASLFCTSIPLYLHRNVERSNNTNAARLFNYNDLCCICG